jgi:hypothetical protein
VPFQQRIDVQYFQRAFCVSDFFKPSSIGKPVDGSLLVLCKISAYTKGSENLKGTGKDRKQEGNWNDRDTPKNRPTMPSDKKRPGKTDPDQRAPLPRSTTPNVLNNTHKSRKRERFFM